MILSLAIPLSACESCNTSSGKPVIGIVDTAKIMRESKASEAARQHLAEVRKVLQQGLANLEKEWKDAPENERIGALNNGLSVLNRQMALEEAAANGVVFRMIQEESARWRLENKAAYVVDRQRLLDADNALDITSEIMLNMNKLEAKFADLPDVSVVEREAVKKSEEEKDPAGKKPSEGEAGNKDKKSGDKNK